MKKQLLEYGFDEQQVEKLLSGKKLNTPHGEYIFKSGVLNLKRYSDGSIVSFTFNTTDCFQE